MKLKAMILTAVTAIILSCSTAFAQGMTYDPITVNLPVTCKLGGFIEMTTEDKTAPVPAEQKIDVNESGEFKIIFDEPGLYNYQVKQVDMDKNLKYDQTAYQVNIHIYDVDGTLKSAATIDNGSETKPSEIIFENKKKSNISGGSSGSSGSSKGSSRSTSGSGPSSGADSNTPPENDISIPEVKGANRNAGEAQPDTKTVTGLISGIAKTGESFPYAILLLALVFSGCGLFVMAKKEKAG